jgi:hypothetical protein
LGPESNVVDSFAVDSATIFSTIAVGVRPAIPPGSGVASNLGVDGVPSPQAVDNINAITSTPYQIFIVKILYQIVLGAVSINSGVTNNSFLIVCDFWRNSFY